MLHYDDSSRDDWALDWFNDPRCTNGYTWVVLDDGRIVELADPGMRTPHAGECRTRNANSHYYGIAATTNGRVPATAAQLDSIVRLCGALVRHHRWRVTDGLVVGHDAEAVWGPRSTKRRELWGKLGRKVDPTGTRADGRLIIDVGAVRRLIPNLE